MISEEQLILEEEITLEKYEGETLIERITVRNGEIVGREVF